MFQHQVDQPKINTTGIPGKDPLYGNCDSRFAFTIVPDSFAQSLLPPDLELAPQTYTPDGYHPLLLMFNDTWLHSNDNLSRIAAEYHLQLNLHYNEFIVMLPYVQFRDNSLNDQGPYCFLPVLYLDSILAVIGGRLFWEFNKEMARFDISPTTFNVEHELSGAPLFSATFTTRGIPVIDNSIANFNAIIPILRLPVIEYGNYGYVSSVYTVEYENLMITPVSMQLNNQSCPFLPPGESEVPSIEKIPMGCFAMNYNWTLTYIKFIKT
ncbi:hypothetical protein [Pollutibacter soli]|uniref:hypothetical protein n=1 Tax=Pollutibacter soli TaxID=3034157 RepID=UPI0030136D19